MIQFIQLIGSLAHHHRFPISTLINTLKSLSSKTKFVHHGTEELRKNENENHLTSNLNKISYLNYYQMLIKGWSNTSGDFMM